MKRLNWIAVAVWLAVLAGCGGGDGAVVTPDLPDDGTGSFPSFAGARWGLTRTLLEMPNPGAVRRPANLPIGGVAKRDTVEFLVWEGIKSKRPSLIRYIWDRETRKRHVQTLVFGNKPRAVITAEQCQMVYYRHAQAGTGHKEDLLTRAYPDKTGSSVTRLIPSDGFPVVDKEQRIYSPHIARMPSGRLAITAVFFAPGSKTELREPVAEYVLFLRGPRGERWPAAPIRGFLAISGFAAMPLIPYETETELRLAGPMQDDGPIHLASEDGGKSWKPAAPFPQVEGYGHGMIIAVTQSGKYAYMVMAGKVPEENMKGGRRLQYLLFASEDHGSTWASRGPIGRPMPESDIAFDVNLAANGPRLAFTFTEPLGALVEGQMEAHLFVSDNGGRKWKPVGFADPPVKKGRNTFLPVVFFGGNGAELHIVWGEFDGPGRQKIVTASLSLGRPVTKTKGG